MEEKKLLFIYNPNAGKGQIMVKLGEIIEVFVKGGYRVEIYPTQAPRDAIQKVMSADDEFSVIVCSGGDGTLDEVATGMVKSGKQIPIGYIPVGTTNDYASSLGLSKNVEQAAFDIVDGEPKPYDVGIFNDDVFVYVAAFGLFTEVTYETNQELKKLFGHMAYVLEGVKSLADVKSYHIKLDIEGQIYEDDFIYGMVTNSASVGGFKKLTGKNVELDDGTFEYTFIRNPKNLMEMQEIITNLLTAEDKTGMILSGKTKRVTVESEEEIPWTLDGEYGGSQTYVCIENLHHGMQIIRLTEEEAEQEKRENSSDILQNLSKMWKDTTKNIQNVDKMREELEAVLKEAVLSETEELKQEIPLMESNV